MFLPRGRKKTLRPGHCPLSLHHCGHLFSQSLRHARERGCLMSRGNPWFDGYKMLQRWLLSRKLDFHLHTHIISYIYIYIYTTSSTAQGGGGSFKNRKPIGEVGCCESRMAERIHGWTGRWLELCFLEWLQWLQWSPHPQLLDVLWCSAVVVVVVK